MKLKTYVLYTIIMLVFVFTLAACGGNDNENNNNNNEEQSHKHIEEILPSLPATCTKTGLTEGKKCSICGEILIKQEIIKVTEHNYIDGKCTVCGADDPDYKIHVHTLSDWEVVKEPTCTSEGIRKIVCIECNELLKTETIDLIAHKYVEGICIVCNSEDPDYVEEASEGLEFKLNSDNMGYTVTGLGTCTDEEVIIPRKYKGLLVTSIGDLAFFFCSSIKSIKIPSTITSIGRQAFALCMNMTSIEVDENNEYYKSIDGNLYSKDEKTLIQYAIAKKETVFVIPNTVTNIGSSVFQNCFNLTCIEVPSSVSKIDSSALYDCMSMTSIEVDENNKYYKSIDGNLYSKDGKTLIQYAIGKEDSDFVIPNTVTNIGNFAFLASEFLISVEIPSSVTNIGEGAFFNCINLINIEIPKTVTSISIKAFSGCYCLSSIEVDKNNQYYQSIDGNLYSKDGKTLMQYLNSKENTKFIIPHTVTSIDSFAFSFHENLTTIEIPKTVIKIDDQAFFYCTNLTIYCEVESKPNDWHDNWNPHNQPVIWGYTE